MRSTRKRKTRKQVPQELLPVAAAMAVVSTDFPRLLTPRETAALLRTTPGNLAQIRHHKRWPGLKFIKVGASVRYLESAVRAFIESGAAK